MVFSFFFISASFSVSLSRTWFLFSLDFVSFVSSFSFSGLGGWRHSVGYRSGNTCADLQICLSDYLHAAWRSSCWWNEQSHIREWPWGETERLCWTLPACCQAYPSEAAASSWGLGMWPSHGAFLCLSLLFFWSVVVVVYNFVKYTWWRVFSCCVHFLYVWLLMLC